jgi:hypothetical protein
MLAPVATMLLHGLWSTRLFEQVFIGPQLSPMQKSWSAIVRGVSFSQSRFMLRPTSSKPFQLPGLSHAGDWT